MTNKLTKTGQWYWRDDEISLKSYYQLKLPERMQHIEFLKTLNPNERSSNDQIILDMVGHKEAVENFFSF
jgi:hypothetical protein